MTFSGEGRQSIRGKHFLKTDQQGWIIKFVMKGSSHTPLPSEYRNLTLDPPDFYHGYQRLIDLPCSLEISVHVIDKVLVKVLVKVSGS